MKYLLPFLAFATFSNLLSEELPDIPETLTVKEQTFAGEKDKTYAGVKPMRAEADALVITHSGGVARIPWEKLPKELQEQFGFDPEKAEAARVAAAKADAARRQAMAEAQLAQAAEKAREAAMERKTYKVMQVIEGGMLVNEFTRGGAVGSAQRAINSITGGGSSFVPSRTGEQVFFLRGTPEGKAVDDDVIDVVVVPVEETFTYDTTIGGTQTVRIVDFHRWIEE